MSKEMLLKKVAYLTDNLNKKARSFRKENLGNLYEHRLNYVTAKYDRKINLTMESGYLTKSKRELGKLSEKDLASLYNDLKSFQTNKDYGTVKKYRKTEKKIFSKTAQGLKETIGEERYNKLKENMTEDELIQEFIKRKKEEQERRGRKSNISSNQILLDMYNDLPNLTEEEKSDTMRAINKMEQARELMSRNAVSMEGRRKNGNR